jgi:uncharacterized protein (UPF0264 family)
MANGESRKHTMTLLLVSVKNLSEAQSAASCADLIDLKNPAAGALGALPLETLKTIRQALPERCLSATIGDLPLIPERVLTAAEQVAATGVDYVKIGLFAGDLMATLKALSPLAKRTALIGVMFADHSLNLSVLETLAACGFAGVMLDTQDKRRGSLTELRPLEELESFIARAKALGLLAGLAGSLRLKDVPRLRALEPDYLGFRGAVCRKERTDALDPKRLAALYQTLHGLLPSSPPALI